MSPPYTDMPSYFLLRESKEEGGWGRERKEDLCTRTPGLWNFWLAWAASLPHEHQLEAEQRWLPALWHVWWAGGDVLHEASIFLEHRKALHMGVEWDGGYSHISIASGPSYIFIFLILLIIWEGVKQKAFDSQWQYRSHDTWFVFVCARTCVSHSHWWSWQFGK